MGVTGADLAYLIAGLALIVALVVPTLVRRVAMSPPIVLLGLGILLGALPVTDRLRIDLEGNRALVEHVAELTVLVALMGVGLAIDRPLRLRNRTSWATWSPTWRLLAVAMPLSIAGVAALGLAAGLPLALAVALGAVLAPTDPVLASDVQVGGPSVAEEEDVEPHPEERSEVRFALTSEAGLNDGLAFPFIHAAIVISAGGAVGPRVAEWVGFHLLARVAVGVGVGILVGAVLGRFAFRSRVKSIRIADRGDPLLALAALLTAYGVAELAQGYGFLAVFACAMTIRAAERGSHYHRGMHELTERLELLLTLLALLFLGIAIGHGLLGALDTWGVAIAAALVFLVRPAAGWISLAVAARPADLPGGLTPAERWTVSFFGVRGIGSVFYLAHVLGALDGGRALEEVESWLWATVAFTILLSVVVHGVLATPVMRRVEQHDQPGGQGTQASAAGEEGGEER